MVLSCKTCTHRVLESKQLVEAHLAVSLSDSEFPVSLLLRKAFIECSQVPAEDVPKASNLKRIACADDDFGACVAATPESELVDVPSIQSPMKQCNILADLEAVQFAEPEREPSSLQAAGLSVDEALRLLHPLMQQAKTDFGDETIEDVHAQAEHDWLTCWAATLLAECSPQDQRTATTLRLLRRLFPTCPILVVLHADGRRFLVKTNPVVCELFANPLPGIAWAESLAPQWVKDAGFRWSGAAKFGTAPPVPASLPLQASQPAAFPGWSAAWTQFKACFDTLLEDAPTANHGWNDWSKQVVHTANTKMPHGWLDWCAFVFPGMLRHDWHSFLRWFGRQPAWQEWQLTRAVESMLKWISQLSAASNAVRSAMTCQDVVPIYIVMYSLGRKPPSVAMWSLGFVHVGLRVGSLVELTYGKPGAFLDSLPCGVLGHAPGFVSSGVELDAVYAGQAQVKEVMAAAIRLGHESFRRGEYHRYRRNCIQCCKAIASELGLSMPAFAALGILSSVLSTHDAVAAKVSTTLAALSQPAVDEVSESEGDESEGEDDLTNLFGMLSLGQTKDSVPRELTIDFVKRLDGP